MSLQLASSSLSTLTAATSPEEAYKVFAGAASAAIGQAIADALAKTIGAVAVQTASTTAISGWEKYVQGLVVDLQWGTPGIKSYPTSGNCFISGPISEPGIVTALGASVSIGISFGC